MANDPPKYRTVKLPARMVTTCRKIVDLNPDCWDSVAAFVRSAVIHSEYWKDYKFKKP